MMAAILVLGGIPAVLNERRHYHLWFVNYQCLPPPPTQNKEARKKFLLKESQRIITDLSFDIPKHEQARRCHCWFLL